MNYFVTGIDTDSGKTLTSAILCEALQADYWKPIQCGLPRDAETVQSLVSNTRTVIHPEKYLLKTPASPHAAAKIENVSINITAFILPNTLNNLVIEGAGGCLVPINDAHFVIDIPVKFNIPVILVADLYLGSINHTLLTVNLLKQKSLYVSGIIFNGVPNPESERIILRHSSYKKLLHIHPAEAITKEIVKKYAAQLLVTLND
jgi:dethiobiotin synthetase